MFPELTSDYISFTESFLRAFCEAKKARLKQQFHGSNPEISNVLLQCSNCAAPNSNYTINCEYCNSPLKIFPQQQPTQE